MNTPKTSRPTNAMDLLVQSHPLQRLHSPSRSWSALAHAAGLASFCRSFQLLAEFPNEISDSYGWHFQFLTIIGLSLATTTFCVGLAADLLLSRKLFTIKNALAVASAPLEVLISVLYWGISAIDRNLVAPPHVRLPLFFDMSLHLFPSIFLLVDLLLLSPPWTISVVPALAVSGTIATGYWLWLEHCFSFNGFYPYPLLDKMPTDVRMIFFAACAMTMTASTLVLKWVYGRFNGKLEAGVPGNIKSSLA